MKKQDSTAICGWETCPDSVKEKVNRILAFFHQFLGEKLTGFYLHGSLAMDCFNPATSDIDFLVVIDRTLSVEQKQNIITYLLGVDQGLASPEMSIVTLESLKNLVYPSPFELHYSNSTRESYTSSKVSWEEQRFDTDLVAHYMAVRERGICLYGKPINEVIPEIPQEMFFASLVQDLHWIRQQIETLDFSYIVLNPCRALAYITEGKFVSKKEAGEWALRHLPQAHLTLIEKALTAYSGTGIPVPHDSGALSQFIDYVIKEFICLAAKNDAENLFFKRSY